MVHYTMAAMTDCSKRLYTSDIVTVLVHGCLTTVEQNLYLRENPYYAHIGYLCETGGRARATNGNNPYGTFGSVAEGVDPR